MFAKPTIKVESSDGHNFVLLEDLVFNRPSGEVITACVGASTDGASTPPFIWGLVPPFGKYWKPAVLHDWMYRKSNFLKEKCDTIFLEAMKAEGVEKVEAYTIYLGVKDFGLKAFSFDRMDQQLEQVEGKQ